MKRTHRTLSLDAKLSILTEIRNKIPYSTIAKKYQIGKTTVCDIKQNERKIQEFTEDRRSLSKKRKTIKSAQNPQLEEALFLWFLQKRALHLPITNIILLQKAEWFQKQMQCTNILKAGEGWLRRFKERFGIRKLKICGERLSSCTEFIEPFKIKFRTIVEQLGLTTAQIYNADESALIWKSFEISTLVGQEERSAPGRKKAKERITFMPCSNADGSNKLRMLVLGKSKNPRPFKNIQLPVYYRSSKKGWMNKHLFKEWFHNEFVPSVRTFSENNNIPSTAILLLDNAPSHYEGNQLESDDGLIKVIYLPPNTTALIQPMDQNVIQCIKMKYRIQLANELLASINVDDRIKTFNMKDAVFMLNNAWADTNTSVIRKSWKQLYGFNDDIEICEQEDLLPITKLIKRLNGTLNNVAVKSKEDIILLLNNQVEEVEYDIYTDYEIMDIVQGSQEKESSDIENALQNIFNIISEECIEINTANVVLHDTETSILPRAALNNIDNLICYAEQQNYHISNILQLRIIRNKILDDINGNI